MMFPFHFGRIFRFQPLLWVVVWYIYMYTYTSFYVHPYLGKMNPFWRAYFSDGLKPPTTSSFDSFICCWPFFLGVDPSYGSSFQNLSLNLSPNNHHHSYYFWEIIYWYCWWFRNPVNLPVEGKVVEIPIIYEGFYHHPNGGCPWDFWLPSTVCKPWKSLPPFLKNGRLPFGWWETLIKNCCFVN